jgi:hypothetical protein
MYNFLSLAQDDVAHADDELRLMFRDRFISDDDNAFGVLLELMWRARQQVNNNLDDDDGHIEPEIYFNSLVSKYLELRSQVLTDDDIREFIKRNNNDDSTNNKSMKDDDDDLFLSADEIIYLNEIVRAATDDDGMSGSSFHGIDSFLGSVVAQESIKILTNQFLPLGNIWIYDGLRSKGFLIS